MAHMTFVNITGIFGEVLPLRGNKPHNGIDIPLDNGTPLRSIVDGVVTRVYENPTIGKAVIIKAENGKYHIFGHLSEIKVKVGQQIHAAQEVIALSGNTGKSTGPHLHYGIQNPDGTFVDPTPLADQLASVTGKIYADAGGHYLFGKPDPGSVMDSLNNVSDWFVRKEAELIFKPIGALIKAGALNAWDWFIVNLPDIMGYTSVLAAICMILSCLIGKGMIKPLAIWAGLMILAMCILAGA